jgi:hypothetical protein
MSKELAQMLLQMKTESREVGSDVVITSQQVTIILFLNIFFI